MNVCEFDKIIQDVVASFAIDHIDISDETIECIRYFYGNKNHSNGKKRIKSKETFQDDKRRK